MAAGGLSAPLAGAAGAPSLARVDWSAPWFAAVADEAAKIAWHDPAAVLGELNARAARRGLATAAGVPLRFADAAALEGPARAYELRVAAGQVPTRLQGEGFVHDALAALVWLRFPGIKAALNALQVAELARDGVQPRRGALRDAVTLFDENALLLAVAPGSPGAQAVLAALRERRWRAAFVEARDVWHRAIVPVAFGHALMQKLLQPFKAITAHAWVVPVAAGQIGRPAARSDRLDAVFAPEAAARLGDRALRMPLPVLGIPGWWPPNARPGFYDDAAVFRSGGANRTGGTGSS